MKSNDGDDLLTEMWLPDGKGPWPVVITRTPYLKDAPADNNAEAQAYARRGIGRIIQRCRGTGGYWEQLRQIPKQIRIPMYIIAGHYDHHLEGTLLGYQLLPEETKAKSRLVVGSWNHFFSITPRMGSRQHARDIDLGVEAFNWFHNILCDGVTPEPQVSVYAVGKDERMTFCNQPLWLALSRYRARPLGLLRHHPRRGISHHHPTLDETHSQ